MAAKRRPVTQIDFDLTDVGNGERFAAEHGEDVRWCELSGGWFVFDGHRFRKDETREVEARVKAVVKAMKVSAAGDDDDALLGHALRSEAAQRVKAVAEMAKSHAGIAITPNDLDANPFLFNVENGTVDLESMRLVPHDRRHLITKLAPVVYDPDAEAPRWLSFLERVQPEEQSRSFLQRLMGVCLCGERRDSLIPIVYGGGANGKTVFFETFRHLFGDYAQTAAAESLMQQRDRVRNDLAAMRGARLVIASESEEGRKFAIAQLKRMTGGEPVRARFLYGEEFEFVPQFLPFVVTNHKPIVNDPGEAAWRRIRLIPFPVQLPESEWDLDLKAKLRQPEELSGILNWALAGYADYRERGRLDEPEAVRVATDEYRQESDPVGQFLSERTGGGLTERKDMVAAYEVWAKANGVESLTATSLAERLRFHGVGEHRTKHGRFWTIGLRDATDDPDETVEPDEFAGLFDVA